MFLLLLVHLLIGSAILLSGDRLGRRAFLVAALAPLGTILWAASQWSTVVGDPSVLDDAGHASGGTAQIESVSWIGDLDLDLYLRFDAFALVMTLLVSGIGLLICVYAVGYFSDIEPVVRGALTDLPEITHAPCPVGPGGQELPVFERIAFGPLLWRVDRFGFRLRIARRAQTKRSAGASAVAARAARVAYVPSRGLGGRIAAPRVSGVNAARAARRASASPMPARIEAS